MDMPGTCNHWHFNPRSHKGSDEVPGNDHREVRISIHAPTRGATNQGGNMTKEQIISIHAPTRGATRHTGAAQAEHTEISIHAPTRGATGISVMDYRGAIKFQSTLPQGERPMLSAALSGGE